LPQRDIDVLPRLPWDFKKGTSFGGRPAPCTLPMRVCPPQDLLDAERWQVGQVRYAPLAGQQARQRRTARLATPLGPERLVDGQPGFLCCFRDQPVRGSRPAARTSWVRVAPVENVALGQRQPAMLQALAPALGKQLGQGLVAAQAELPEL